MSDHDRDVERETTIIHTGERDGGGGGTIVAVLLIIAVIALLFYLFGGNLFGGGETTDIKADVDVSAPAEGGGS